MSNKIPLALIALAIIMLVGCKEPVGLPNERVHVASLDTLVIPVNYGEIYAGYVINKSDGNPIEGWFETHYQDTITWGYLIEVGPYYYGRLARVRYVQDTAVLELPEYPSVHAPLLRS